MEKNLTLERLQQLFPAPHPEQQAVSQGLGQCLESQVRGLKEPVLISLVLSFVLQTPKVLVTGPVVREALQTMQHNLLAALIVLIM